MCRNIYTHACLSILRDRELYRHSNNFLKESTNFIFKKSKGVHVRVLEGKKRTGKFCNYIKKLKKLNYSCKNKPQKLKN